MMPPQQRLEADHFAGPEVDLRLVNQGELAARTRAAQIPVEPNASGGLRRQPMVEQLETVATPLLRPIEGRIGMAQ